MRRLAFFMVILVAFASWNIAAAVADDGLQDADQAARDQTAKDAIKGVIGKDVKVGALNLVVRSITFDETIEENGTDDVARISLTLHVENRSGGKQGSLDFNVACINQDETGGWYADSTYKMNASFPARSFRDGVLYLGVPGNCTKPRVRVGQTGTSIGSKPKVVDYRLPASIVSQFGGR